MTRACHLSLGDPVMTRTCACLAALLLSATGCGDNDEGAQDPTVDRSTAEVTMVVKRLEKFFEFGYEATSRIPTCIATGLVDEVGIERLQSGGALDKNLRVRDEWHLPRTDANMMADVWLACEDYKLYAAKLVAEEPDMNDPYVRRCIREVTEADVRELVVTQFSGSIDESDMPTGGLPAMFEIFAKFERAGCGFEGD